MLPQMKAALITAHGGPENLQVGEVPTPSPAAGDVQVKIGAAALNHLDLWVRRGLPGLHLELPHWTGADGAGVVSAVGAGVRGVKEGDAVVVNPVLSCGRCRDCLIGRDNICREFGVLGEHRRGCLAEYVVVPAQNVIAAPKGVALHAQAATPTTYMTAWQMLVEKARVQPGELVLVWAAGSGVGVAATQIAKLFGAQVIATASTDEKLARAKEQGADHTINSRAADFLDRVKAISRRGVDIVFEHTGADTWPKSILAAARGARIVTCGATSGFDAKTDLRHVFFRQLQIFGSTMARKGDLYTILEHVAAGWLRPVIDKVFKLADARAAQERLEHREQFGKIIVEM
jgi:NADPH:quinone reductase-like Zn-dependent oxidoreductase